MRDAARLARLASRERRRARNQELPGVPMAEALRAVQDHIAEDHKTLRAIWLIHHSAPNSALCVECGKASPCRTQQALEGFAADLEVSVEDSKRQEVSGDVFTVKGIPGDATHPFAVGLFCGLCVTPHGRLGQGVTSVSELPISTLNQMAQTHRETTHPEQREN